LNQTMLNTIAGVIGAIVTFAFGGWSEALTCLVIAMGIDYVTGVSSAWKEKSLNSQIGFWGLAKKGLILLIIMLAHRIDLLLDINMIMGGAIYFYIANELISIIENYGRLGLPLPEQIKNIITILKDKKK